MPKDKDFKPTLPALRGSVSRGGEINWKDESTQLSMWLRKDRNGKFYVNGKVGNDPDKKVVLFLVDDQDGEYKLTVEENNGGDDW